MPRWTPENKWKGQDVFIIGGGLSLKGFDWGLLKDEFTIGCNDAFLLGEKVCDICVFGDHKWFKVHYSKLAKFKNPIFTNTNHLCDSKTPKWVWWMQRRGSGFHKDALGWNENTGALAINLALILGAKKIFLLGFDMKILDIAKKYNKRNQNNWHENLVQDPNLGSIQKHINAFKSSSSTIEKNFPGVKIINITDDSDLDIFPKIGVDKFWDRRNKKCVA